MGEAYKRLAGKSILIVEDEWLIADDLVRVIVDEGALVVGPASSLSQAMGLLNTASIDAAVLDVHLGEGCSVYILAEALQARGVPFVFATGYDERSIRSDFSRVPHITKPYEPRKVGTMLFEAAVELEAA